MRSQVEITRNSDQGWAVVVDGLDIAPAASSIAVYLTGTGGMLSVNGMPRTLISMEMPQLMALGVVTNDLDDATKAALRMLGWIPASEAKA